MTQVFRLYRSTIGKKVAMALSGILLFGFVLAHMIGNLKIYQGPEKYDAYAEFLREVGYPVLGHGQGLWLARIFLLAAVGVHIASAVALARVSAGARRHGYKKRHDLSFSYASRTMRWGGAIVLGFIVYHLLHLTLGTVHPQYRPGSVYANVVSGFRQLPVALAYIACMIPLGLHLYHGLWSMTQTLALDNPRVLAVRRPAAAVFAVVVVLGNISIPLAVLTGLVGG